MRRKMLPVLAVLLQVGCATTAAPLPPGAATGAQRRESREAPAARRGITGTLVVYSATYASTLEESEYPAHTDYTVATPSDTVIERVANRTGSFDKRPASVNLPPGEYHVRAQYSRGGFVIIPIIIETGKITTVSLDGSPIPPSETPAAVSIRGPDGAVIGWRVTKE